MPPPVMRSASAASPGELESTEPFSTAIANCSNNCTRSKLSPWMDQALHPPSREPRCRPTCLQPSTGLPALPAESSTSNAVSSNCWVNKRGAIRDLGPPYDIDQLQQRISSLDAQLADMKIQLDERDDELAAARLANREMMVSLNASPPST